MQQPKTDLAIGFVTAPRIPKSLPLACARRIIQALSNKTHVELYAQLSHSLAGTRANTINTITWLTPIV